VGFLHEIIEESGFTCSCFSGEKDISAGVFYEIKKVIIHSIFKISDFF
jgi:hypothetical protein